MTDHAKPSRWERTTSGRVGLSAIAAIIICSLLVAPQVAGATTGIGGTVTDTNEAPISGLQVCAYNAGNDQTPPVACNSAGPTGEYEITGLAPGQYKVEFTGNLCGMEGCTRLNFVRQYYHAKSTRAAADPVTVAAEAVTPNIDGKLKKGATISGTVISTAKTPLQGISVCVTRNSDGQGECAQSNVEGAYKVIGLDSGDYRISFSPGEGSYYLSQYYDHKRYFYEADLLPVTAGQTKVGIDGELEKGGAITGTVTDPDSEAIKGIQICGLEPTNEFGPTVECTQSDKEGKYKLALPTGSFKIVFNGSSCGPEGCFQLNYVREYYNNKAKFSDAEPVTVNVGETKAGINAKMEEGGSIAGTVTDESNEPINGLQVCAHDPSTQFPQLGCTQTTTNGEYKFVGLPQGSYKIHFTNNSNVCGPEGCVQLNYVPQYYNGASQFSEADPVSVTKGGTTAGINAKMEKGASVSGTVTNQTTKAPIAGLQVCANDANSQFGGPGQCSSTDTEGKYTIAGLAAGEYKVQFTNNSNVCGPEGCEKLNYVREYYDDTPNFETAETLTLVAGQVKTGIDAELAPGGSISGTVTATGGGPIQGLQVCANEVTFEGSGECTQTNVGGEYSIAGLPAGQYKVQFTNNSCGPEGCAQLNYVPEFYNDKPNFQQGDTLSVVAGQTKAGINAELDEGGSITGTVTDTGGEPIEGIQACAQEATGEFFEEGGNECARTDEGGHYTIAGLRAGAYKVQFWNSAWGPEGFEELNYVPQYYDGKANFHDADPVSVTVGGTVEEIDAELVKGATISGTVTDTSGKPIQYAQACASEPDDPTEEARCAQTNASGEYTIMGLRTGEYSVFFSGNSCGPEGCYDLNYVSESYNDKSPYEEPDLINIIAGEEETGIDAELEKGATISGTVIDATTKAPVAGLRVCPYDVRRGEAFEEEEGGCATTDAAGKYTLIGLDASEYRVQFTNAFCGPEFCEELNYVRQYWQGKDSFADASLIDVVAGGTKVGINAEMKRGAQVTGTVTDSDGKPIAGTVVCVNEASGKFVEGLPCNQTDADGKYTLKGIPSGKYKVEFTGELCHGPEWECSPSFYVPQFFDEKSTFDEATSLTLSTGQTKIGIDAELEEGGMISGRVTDAVSDDPLVGLQICAYPTEGEGPGACSNTDDEGEYELGGLRTGAYYVEFTGAVCDEEEGCPPSYYVHQFYEGAASIEDADEVAVEAGKVTDEIDAELDRGGEISGAVTDSGEGLLGGISVCAYESGGSESEPVECTETDGAGSYSLILLADSYVVEFSGPGYATQFYNGKTSFGAANPVTVTTGATHEGINAKLLSVAPINTTPPVVSGTPAVGQVLTCSTGSWEHNPTSYTFAWLRDGSPISGQVANTYAVQGADSGHGISCRVTAANAAGSATVTSNTVQVPAAPPSTPAPASPSPPAEAPQEPGIGQVPGTAQVKSGKALLRITCSGDTACKGVVKLVARSKGKSIVIGTANFSIAAGVTKTVSVKLNSKGTSLLRKAGKRGLKVTLTGSGVKSRSVTLKAKAQASASRSDLGNGTARSPSPSGRGSAGAASNVLNVPPVSLNTAAPVLTGTPALGEVLSCSTESEEGSAASFAFTWLRDGDPIPGYAANTYTVQPGDQGHGISCEVTASTPLTGPPPFRSSGASPETTFASSSRLLRPAPSMTPSQSTAPPALLMHNPYQALTNGGGAILSEYSPRLATATRAPCRPAAHLC